MAGSTDFVLVPRADFAELLTALAEVESLLESLARHRFAVRMLRLRLEARVKEVPAPRRTVADIEEP